MLSLNARLNHKWPSAKLFKLLALVALVQLELLLRQQHSQVLAKPRGLIYNRDGKFIFKPPKSDQGHIIVIEDRYRANKDKEREASASEQSPDAYPQLMGSRLVSSGQRASLYPTTGAYQLINIDPRQLVPAGHQSSAFMSHPSAGMQSQAATGLRVLPGSIQMVPVVQVLHPSALTKPPMSGYGGQIADYELAADQQVGSPFAMPGAQQYGQQQQVGFGSQPRPNYRPMMGYDQPYGYESTNDYAAESPPMSLFDDQMARPAPRQEQQYQQSYRQHPSQRRRSSPSMSSFHDLDRLEDTDAGHLDLHDDFGRSRGMGPLPGHVGPSSYELLKQLDHQPIGVAEPTQEPPIGRPKKHVKKPAVTKPKQHPMETLKTKSLVGNVDTLDRAPVTLFDETVTSGDVNVISAQSKDPKSSQYWKQFKDQFDIMTK